MKLIVRRLQSSTPILNIIMAGTVLATVLSSDSWKADCAPKKKQKAANDKPAKKAGPALTAIKAALAPDKTYNVEKLLASRCMMPCLAPPCAMTIVGLYTGTSIVPRRVRS